MAVRQFLMCRHAASLPRRSCSARRARSRLQGSNHAGFRIREPCTLANAICTQIGHFLECEMRDSRMLGNVTDATRMNWENTLTLHDWLSTVHSLQVRPHCSICEAATRATGSLTRIVLPTSYRPISTLDSRTLDRKTCNRLVTLSEFAANLSQRHAQLLTRRRPLLGRHVGRL